MAGRPRLTLGLYNSYHPTKFMEAHRRALCRAGAIAFGFDANLALFGFPFPTEVRTPQEISRWVSEDSSIGNEGRNFIEVADSGRVVRLDHPDRGFPPQFGLPVGTTCHPDSSRALSIKEAVALMARQSLLVMMGLGPKGLPSNVLGACRHHLDITGRGASLETCTAMGAIVAVLVLGSEGRF